MHEASAGKAGQGYGNPVWEDLFRVRTWGQYPSEESVRFVKRAQSWGLSGDTALDIGAGQGACAWMLLREGFRVTALEGAPSGASHILKTTRAYGAPVDPEVLVADIVTPARFLAGRRFDLLLDHYSLCSNPKASIASAFREYRGLIKPDGYFLTCGFGKRTISYGKGTRVGEDCYSDIPEGLPLSGRGCCTFFDKEGVSALLADAGFAVKHIEAIMQEDGRGGLEKIIVYARPV
ncbi:MAG: class I SAM-dependent methyltransferase [Fibrobacteres bacterium]|nr:class I SAM-dependent methyltransferase [Fibrobacterota bacterium]